MSERPTTRLQEMRIEPDASVAEALARMDAAGTGGLALCTPEGKLVGFLTDGDIRRAVLRGITMDQPCETVASRSPVVARGPLSLGDALNLMTRHDVNHLPIVDEDGILCDLLLRNELATTEAITDAAARQLESVIIDPEASISEAIAQLDRAGTGALALCNRQRRLLGMLTDGDLRRAILRDVPLTDRCETIAITSPVIAQDPISAADALNLMVEHNINHLPVLDSNGELRQFLMRRDMATSSRPALSAVIVAGGLGKRLLPLTEHLPKPMLPVGDRPLIERTVKQLRRSGIRDVSMTTHYLQDRIVAHFGDGQEYGVRIDYVNEDEPLGTAGGLKLIERPAGPLVVINGDILTGLSFEKMLDFHLAHEAEITVGVRRYVVDVPFGVVECDDVAITQLREKPSYTLFINAGIYVLQPTAYDSIPDGQYFDMTDLIKKLLDEARTVVSFPIIEYWLDIGSPEDYQQAQEYLRNEPV